MEMDFSENIAIKTKNKVQEAHFSGKQCVLHCKIPLNLPSLAAVSCM